MPQTGRFVEKENSKIKYTSSPAFFGYRSDSRGFFVYLKKIIKKLQIIEIWNCILPSGRQYE